MLRKILSVASPLLLCLGAGSKAEAITIRTPLPDDPAVVRSSYGTSVTVTDAYLPDKFSGGQKNRVVSRLTPISDELGGVVCANDNGSCTPLKSNAQAIASNDHLGTVKASVQSQGFETGAIAMLSYSFMILGPDADFVPVTISGFGQADESSGQGETAGARARITVDYYNRGLTPTQWTHSIAAHEHNAFSETFDIRPNKTPFQRLPTINLEAVAFAGTTCCVDFKPSDPTFYGGRAFAEIDPLITIADPKLAELYTIVVGLSSVSLPTGPVSPVPLPASAPMFGAALLGFAGLGYAAKRKKTAAA